MRKDGSLPRISGFAGIVGPITFVIIYSVLGQITPGYSAVSQVISNLELAPYGWVQQINFLQMGTLIIIFAFGFRRAMMRKYQRKLTIPSALLILSGLGMIDAAYFTPALPVEHRVGFLFFMIPLLIAIFLLGREFLRASELRNLGFYSLASGLLALILLLYFFLQGASAPVGGVPNGPIGVVNRIFVMLALSWFCLVGAWLIRTGGGSSASATQISTT